MISTIGGWTIFLQPKNKVILTVSTTTSLYETGFLDILDAKFEEKYPDINVTFISQGTGKAILTAKNGDADMILVHDAAREETFLKEGYGVNRKIVAYNFFVIVGPEEDPAGIFGLSPTEALLAIKEAGETGKAIWISRGDDSGTHAMEKRLWTGGEEDISQIRETHWYLERGSGMAATLALANEKRAYTICDKGSYLNSYVLGVIDLEIMVETGDIETLNVYSVIACDPQNSNLNHVNFDEAMKFIKFLVSDEIQELFGEFGLSDYDLTLFNPAVEILKKRTKSTIAGWIEESAYIDGSECPNEKQYKFGDLTFLN